MEEEKGSVYLETSIVSYYTSRPSPDPIVRTHQEITRKWWPAAIKRYNIFISEMVIKEAGIGDINVAKKRLEEIDNFPRLKLEKNIEELAQLYIVGLDIPSKKSIDAFHLAFACINEIDYLVTWNCSHLCNGEIIKKLMKINAELGIHTPIVCTPEYLMEVSHVEGSDCL